MRKHYTRYKPLIIIVLFIISGLSFNVLAQTGPEISDIGNQSVSEGTAFATVNLDEVVADPDNTDDQLTWSFSDNNELLVSIEDHIAMIEVPNSDWFGEETILFTVIDPDSNFDSDEAVFTVVPVNDPPVVSDIPGQTISEGGSFGNFDLDNYVSDIDNETSSLSWTVSNGTNLTASIDASHNTSVAINNSGWTGSEALVFEVSDLSGATDSDDALFTVTDVQNNPVAADDSYIMDEGANLSTPAPGVLSNDSDADGDLLSALLVSDPDYSTSFNLNADGSFLYVHDGSPVTDDSFTYYATDDQGQSAEATVHITINQLNDIPQISGVPGQTVTEGTDFQPVDLDPYISDEEDSDGLLALSSSGTTDLNVNINGSTHVATINKPDKRWVGSEVVTFRVTDTDEASAVQAVTFSSTELAEAPVAQPDAYSVNEGATLNIAAAGVLSNDTDGDGDPLAAELVSGPAFASSFSLNTDGSFSYTHNGNETGNDSFTYRAYDGTSYSNTVTVSITVTQQNDPPVVSDIPDQSVAEGSSFTTIDLNLYVADPDHPDNQINWSYSGNTELTVNISAGKVATITIPSTDWNGSETITFTATDPSSDNDSDPATFTVTSQNDPPVVTDIPDQTIAEGATFATINLDGYVSDPDHADNQMVWTYSGNSQLTVNISASRVATITIPSTDWNGSETITFTATDPASGSDSDQATFTVTAQNDPPVVTDIPNQSIAEGFVFATINLDSYVSDPDHADNQMVWSYSGNSQLTVNISPSRVATITIPSSDWNGSETITFTATDPSSGNDSDPATFTVTSQNDPPIVSDIPNQSVEEGSAFSTINLDNYVSDPDHPDNQLTWSYSGNTQLTVNISASRVATITIPSSDWNGSETITFTATDPSSGSDSDPATFTVTAVNDAPVLAGIESAALTYSEGDGAKQITNTINVSDIDNSTMTSAVITISNNYQNGQDVLAFPNGFGLTGSWSPSQGQIILSGSASVAQMQSALRAVTYENTSKNPVTTTRTVRFVISDGLNSNAVTRNITLGIVNDPPVLGESLETPVNFTENGGSVRLTNTITVADEDNTNISSATVSITSGLSNTQDILTFIPASGITGSYNQTTGILTFNGSATLLTYQSLLRSVRYDNSSEAPDIANRVISFIVNDGTNFSNIVTKTVTITAVNDQPVATNVAITASNNRIGTLHTGSYIFTDPDGDEPGTHIYQWYRSAFSNGTSPIAISGATSVTYTPTKSDGGNYIGFEITPVDEHGLAGLPARTATFSYINAAPVAINPHVYAPQSVPGSTISGRFTYSDKESNPRGNSIFVWYRANTSTPTPSSPGTLISIDSTYRLRNTEAGKWVWFKVKPVATTGSTPGDSVWSNVIGPIGSYTANLAGSDTFCYGSVMPVTLTITGGKAPYTAILHRAGTLAKDTTISNINSSPRIINVRIPGTYTLVEVTDEAGDNADISAADPVSLVISPRSKARITGTTSICQGIDTHAQLTLDFQSGAKPWSVTIRRGEFATYDTVLNDITSDPYPFMARIIGSGPTRHRVVAISDANGCPGDTASGSAYLRYKTSPIAVISGSDSICPGEPANLTVTLTSGTTPWSFTYLRNGAIAGTYANITNTTQTVPISQTGIYTLSVVTDPGGSGCGSGEAIIAGHTAPSATISGNATICEHATANLTVNLTGKSPWKFAYHRNLTLDSTVVENVLASPRIVQVKKAGTYRLYQVIDRNGCRGTVSGSAVISVTPAPDVTISGLKVAYNYAENEIDTIIGTPPGGDYAGPGVLGNFFLPTIAGLGTHNITYRYRTSPSSCYGYDTAVVNVLESDAKIIFENNRTKYCKNDAPFTVRGINVANSIGFFTISGGAGLLDHGDNTATIYPDRLNPNRYTVTYTYPFGGDFFPIEADIDIGPAPIAMFNWATECFREGQSIDFINSSSSAFGFLSDTSYFWKITTFTGYDSDSSRNITYTFPDDGIYNVELKILNSYGCADTIDKDFNLRPTFDLNQRYEESFELHPIAWQRGSETVANSWTLGNPSKHEIPPRGFSGAYNDTACWYTKITRIPAPVENSWVTSPCFDFSNTNRPMLTMNIWRLFNSNRDGANIQATADSGKTWNLVGEIGDGENWFNTSNIRGVPGGKDDGWSNYDGASNDGNWVRARHGLDYLKGKKNVQFRIAYGSDGTPQNNDGIAFDAFTISERTKMALIEHFTNSSDSECEKADSVLDLFVEQYGMHAIDIQYHTSNPPGDPFYTDNPVIPTSRQFYYGLSAVPYAVIDGGSLARHNIDYDIDSKPFDRNLIIRQSLSDGKFQIRVVATRTGNTLNSSVFLIANEQLPLIELSVRSAVVESLVEGISGANGDTVFRNVVRTMLPNAAGNTLYKSWNLIEDMELDDTWEIENVNDVNRLMVVAFIQNEATKEVYNVAADTVVLSTSSNDPLPVPSQRPSFVLYPNPAQFQAMVKLNSTADSDIILQLFSNTGMLVYTSKIRSGDQTGVIPVQGLPDGLYILRLMSKNKLLGIRKLIITK